MDIKKFLKRQPAEFQAFYSWAEDYAKKHGKTITLVDSDSVFVPDEDETSECGGYCDEGGIVVPFRNKKHFIPVFTHEFAHMMQCVEKDPTWVNENGDLWGELNLGEEVTWNSVIKIIQCEHNCEARAIKLGKRWGLFNIEEYAQRANAYINLYHYVYLTNRWTVNGVYDDKRIVSKMPTKLINIKNLNNINMEYMLLLDSVYNKKNPLLGNK